MVWVGSGGGGDEGREVGGIGVGRDGLMIVGVGLLGINGIGVVMGMLMMDRVMSRMMIRMSRMMIRMIRMLMVLLIKMLLSFMM